MPLASAPGRAGRRGRIRRRWRGCPPPARGWRAGRRWRCGRGRSHGSAGAALEKRGHTALAIDLPGHGKRVDEDATLARYRDAVVEVSEPGDVLVGHSMGGFTDVVLVR
ncbi:alpha/beta hydrolase [Frankia sp. Ea1.12]|uniref:alpha/beta fold hydrolase n=1 Tax=Parafrankia sp. Ea1.12 TaxID=573499 RepID=UPI00190F97D4